MLRPLLALCCLLPEGAGVTISPADLRLSRAWTHRHFGNLSASTPLPPLPFSFRLGGRPSAELLPSWRRTAVKVAGSDDGGGQGVERHRLTFTDPASGLVLTVNVSKYEQHPAVEWVMSFHNTGAQNTAALTEVRAADAEFVAGTSAFELSHALAYGEGVPSDYMPQETRIGCQPGCTCDSPTGWQVPGDTTCGCVNPGNPPGPAMQQPQPTVDRLTLGTNGGRSSSGGIVCPPYDGPIGHQNNGSLPFFNLAIPGRGGVFGAVGWSGQWEATFSCANSPTCHAPRQHYNCVRDIIICASFLPCARGEETALPAGGESEPPLHSRPAALLILPPPRRELPHAIHRPDAL